MKNYLYTKLPTSEEMAKMPTSTSLRRTVGLAALFIVTFYCVIALFKTSQNLVLVVENLEDSNQNHPNNVASVSKFKSAVSPEVNAQVTDLGNEIEFKLQHCECKRRLSKTVINSTKTFSFNETTCSYDAYLRGIGQKIAGFSFYGDINSDHSKKKGYFQGIVGNLEMMPKFYPGWIMRLYYDLDRRDPILQDLCDLACSNPGLDICDAKHLPGTPFKDASRVFAMNWRFFPTLDPQVDVFISRDLDSRFSDRELAAVNEWLKSDKDVHTMRDHPDHGTQMLGSAWGSKLVRDEVRNLWEDSWYKGFQDALVWAKRNDYGPDQAFLTRYVWPWAKRLSMGHDSYLCKKYLYSQPFPTQRKNEPNNFVAAVVNENNTLWRQCPWKCRPADHKDWKYC